MTNSVLETKYVIRKKIEGKATEIAGPDAHLGYPLWYIETVDVTTPAYHFDTFQAALSFAMNELNAEHVLDLLTIEPLHALDDIDYEKYPRVKRYESVNVDAEDYNYISGKFIVDALNHISQRNGVPLSELNVSLNYYDEHPISMEVNYFKVETDEVYRDRVKRQIAYEQKKANDRKNSRKSKEEKERAEYERLKKKFEEKE